MKKLLPILAVIVIIGVVVATATGKNNDNNSTAPPPSSSNQSTNPTSSSNPTSPNPTNPNPAASTDKVTIHDLAFSPTSITVKKGATVTWTNNDSTAHTVTSDSGSELNSDNLEQGESYSHTFNTVGTFAYHCSIHTNMTAKVTVTE
jgi:plastocyanin